MDLYRIDVAHYSQKDSHESIECLLLANSKESVYYWVDEELNYGRWAEATAEEESGEREKEDIYDDKYNVIGKESVKQKMLRVGGTFHDGDYELYDLYYGATTFGWTLLKECVSVDDYRSLINLEVVKVVDGRENKK